MTERSEYFSNSHTISARAEVIKSNKSTDLIFQQHPNHVAEVMKIDEKQVCGLPVFSLICYLRRSAFERVKRWTRGM